MRTDGPPRSQVGPKVSGISGSIHKKFKTRAEAWRAFNRATHEGAVRAVRVDPESDTASSSDSPFPPRAARDNRRPSRQQQRTQGEHGREIERPAPVLRPGARPQSYFRRRRATDPTYLDIMSSAHAGPSGIAGRMDRIAMGGEPQNRRQGFNQETFEYVSNVDSSASPSSRPVRPPTRGRSHERWQGSQYGPVDALQGSSRADSSHVAIAHREARPVSTSAETRRRSRESPGTAVLQSAGSSYSIHMVSLLPQIEDDVGTPGNAAHTHGTPLRSSPLMTQNRRTDIEPEGFDGLLSTDKPLTNILDFDSAYTPRSPIASSRAYDKGDEKGKRRASVQSFDTYLDSFDWSEIQEKAFIQQTTVITDDHPSVPVLSRPPSACSHISLVSSAESFRSVMSFDIHVEVLETSESPGRSTHVLDPTPQCAVSPFSISGSVEGTIPDPPIPGQQCLNDEEDGTNAPTTTRPPPTPSDDSRSFGILVDSTSPLSHTHFPRMDRQCLGQCAPEVCPALSRSPSPPVARSATHPLTQSSHLSLIDIDISASSPCRTWPLLSSLPPQPQIDPEAEVSVSPEVIGLGLSIEDAALPSSQRHALPHRTASQSSPRILANLPAGNTEEQSLTRDDDRSQSDAPPNSQGQTPPSCSWEVAYHRAPSGGTRSMNGAASSPRNLPLPSSPSPPRSATSSTSTHLQAQPSHRLGPNHPFYPSLASDDDDTVTSGRQSISISTTTRAPPQQHRLSPSGLHDLAFGLLPALGLSPVVQVPPLIRSPLTDPLSPIHLDADTGCRRRRSLHGFITVAYPFHVAPFIHFANLRTFSLTGARFLEPVFSIVLRLLGMMLD